MDENANIPGCVGIIMDGNRRWAKARGLPSYQGHSAGREKLKEFLTSARKAGVKHVIAFAFSTENWKRAQEEVMFLLELMLKAFRDDREEFIKEKVQVRFAGALHRFPPELQEAMKKLEDDTRQFEGMSLTLCVSYGGREEIVHAANACVADGITAITEEDISKHVYTAGVPDPDMIIRTSGEMRSSGFLPWQAVYSELFFTDTLWPDFSEEEFLKMIAEYGSRERRIGK
jgi:undecaprenyl diphosphate synthase